MASKDPVPNARKALVAARLRERLARSAAPSKPALADRYSPLAPTQEGLWMVWRLHPNQAIGHRPLVLRLQGPWEPQRLAATLDHLRNKHSCLRTRFPEIDGAPVQEVLGNVPQALAVRSYTDTPEDERWDAAIADAKEHTLVPFDLAAEPPFKPLLLQLDAADHLLVIAMHHIVFDGWSEAVFCRDLLAHYETATGASEPADPAQRTYADWSAVNAEQLQSTAGQRSAEFWRTQLSGLRPPQLPGGASDPGKPSFAADYALSFDAELVAQLRRTVEQHDATLYMGLLAAVQLWIGRIAATRDVVIGTPVAGRNQPGCTNLVGCLINMLAMRTSLVDITTIADLLAHVRHWTLEALDHQQVPFARVAAAIQLPPSLRSPLPVTFQLRNMPQAPREGRGGRTLDVINLDSGLSAHDLAISAVEVDGALRCTITYATDRFEQQQIETWGQDLHRAVEGLAQQNPHGLLPDATSAESLLQHTNLTHRQLQIDTASQLHEGTHVFPAIRWALLRGVDPTHIEQAFVSVVADADALRMKIERDGRLPHLRVHEEMSCEFLRVDLRRRKDPEQAAMQWMQGRAQVPFDDNAALFDCALLQITDTDYYWYLSLSHLIADGWTLRLVVSETLERAATVGTAKSKSSPKPKRAAFPSFAEWMEQRRQFDLARLPMSCGSAANDTSLYGRDAAPEAPDSSPTKVSYIDGAFDKVQNAQLDQIAQRPEVFWKNPEVSRHNLLVALFALTLWRTSGDRQQRIGICLHQRRSPDEKRLVGLCMDLVTIELEIDPAESLIALVGRVHELAGDAARRSRSAGTAAVEAHPEFVVNLENRPALDVPSELVLSGHDTSAVSLFLGHDAKRGFTYRLELAHRALDAERRVLFGRHFEHICVAASAVPQRPVGETCTLRQEDLEQLRAVLDQSWPTSQVAGPLLLERFEQQARENPTALAVVHEDRHCSYAELNRRANQIGHTLQRAGVGAESHVAILLDRSVDLVASLLAVWKSGGAWIPISSEYPQSRVALLVEDCQPRLVITTRDLAHRLPASVDAICLDSVDAALASEPETNLGVALEPSQLAYIIYTSGSTGRPKGVLIEQRAVASFSEASRVTADLGVGDRVLQSAAFTFDMFVEELRLSLGSGAALVLRPPEVLNSIQEFLRVVREQRVTCSTLATAYWHELVRHLARTGERLPQHLHTISIGGERAQPDLMREWLAGVGGSTIVCNTYGPTEATIYVTVWRGDPDELRAGEEVPIGLPVPGVAAFVLDEDLLPVLPWVPGELCVAGPQVARGYWQREEATRRSFPFAPPALGLPVGTQLYRTGDRVRIRRDGMLIYLGRFDDQVQIRGFRVEPGEVEAALRQAGEVESVAVVVPDTVTDDPQLVAYVTPTTTPSDKVRNAIIAWARAELPEYLVPAAIEFLPKLPITSNGKVDRKLLAARVWQRPGDACGVEQRNPTNAVEHALLDIWRDVLPVTPVGIEEDFFSLGGHSLLAVRLISRIREELGADLPMRQLFETPTIAALAAACQSPDEQPPAPNSEARPTRQSPAGSAALVPLSAAQERLWLIERMEVRELRHHLVVAFRVHGAFDDRAFEAALQLVVQRHDALRTTFHEVDGEPRQRVHDKRACSLLVADATAGEPLDEQFRAHLARELREPFDLAAAPPVRAQIIRIGADESFFSITLHHIVGDGWSIHVLLRDLFQLYEIIAGGNLPAVPPLSLQYPAYALRERQQIESGAFDEQTAYWQRKLGGSVAELDLPTDFPRTERTRHSGGVVEATLAREHLQSLHALARAESGTLFMVVLTAFQVLLSRWSGQSDVTVGTPIAQRNHRELENMIGFFVNSVALRSDLSGDPTFRMLLTQVRDTTLDAFAHSDVPFERVIEAVEPVRNLQRTPIFQVFLNMLSLPSTQTLSGLEIERMRAEESVVNFDCTIYVQEQADGLELRLVYNADLFTDARMHEFMAQFQMLLAAVGNEPDQSISSYSLRTQTALKCLPDAAAELHDPGSTPIVRMIADCVAQRADAPALSFGGQTWTYRQLWGWTASVAAKMEQQGVGHGSVIAIASARVPALVPTVLAALCRGAIVTILDPAHPAPRQCSHLDSARPGYLVTLPDATQPQAAVVEALRAGGGKVVAVPPATLLDTESPAESGKDAEANAPDIVATTADDFAFIGFTSGSTGQPQGVLCRHGSLSAFLPWQLRRFELGPDDRYSLLAGLAHDPLQRELFTSLASGATLCLPPTECATDPRRIVDWLGRERITVAHLTPAHIRLLSEAAGGQQLEQLRCAFVTGEALTGLDVAALRELAPAATCVNFYGATESQRAVGYSVIDPDMPCPATVPVGIGIDGVQLLVGNSNGEPAGVGELGEIYIRSRYLAQGYLGNRERTNSRFLPDPNDAAGQLYRTGDLGRYDADGCVDFAGRRDRQLQIRGLRVEPQEVEATLLAHAGIAHAIVTPIAAADGATLCAYIVLRQGCSVPAEEVQAWVGARLPDPFVPSVVCFLPTLPVTPNGKIDHSALPVPSADSAAGDTLANRSDAAAAEIDVAAMPAGLERTLVELWQQVLGRPVPNLHSSFFDLSGTSLLAVRLFAAIRKQLGQDLPLATLFEAPTVAELAKRLHSVDSGDWSYLVPVRKGQDEPVLFCVHGAGGNVISYRHLAANLPPEVSIYGLQAGGLDGRRVTHTSIQEMAAEYVTEIRSLQPEGPYYLAGYSSGGWVAYEMARQLEHQGADVARVFLLDSHFPGQAPRVVQRRERGLRSQIDRARERGLVRTVVARCRWEGQRLALRAKQVLNRMILGCGGTLPPALRPIHIFDANLRLIRAYEPAAYGGHVTLLLAESDRYFDVRRDGLERWDTLLELPLDLETLPGHHDGAMHEQFADAWGAAITTRIQQPINGNPKHATASTSSSEAHASVAHDTKKAP
ncbi:MAG: amino acid adenylation domain-containing protein [Planctomycetota bacterium]